MENFEKGFENLRKNNQERNEVAASREQSTREEAGQAQPDSNLSVARNTSVPVLVIFVASAQELLSRFLIFPKTEKFSQCNSKNYDTKCGWFFKEQLKFHLKLHGNP